jgi:hypothetical protein
MAVDQNNILRVDLTQIYKEAERRSMLKCRALQLDIDDFGISPSDYPQLHSFASEAATIIGDKSGMVKTTTQTGFDAITYIEADDVPDPDQDVDVDEDGETDFQEELMGDTYTVGEKLASNDEGFEQDTIEFNIDKLNLPEDEANRYTVFQRYIFDAMVHYVLHKWFDLMGQAQASADFYRGYEAHLGNLKFNSSKNFNRLGQRRPYFLY